MQRSEYINSFKFFRFRAHAGQVSFPGGRCDNNETAEETALRETYEEIGVHSDNIDIWTKMNPVSDKKGKAVSMAKRVALLVKLG